MRGTRRAGRKIGQIRGFTTLEMLLTTLILALATAVGASGIHSVDAVYKRTMAKSDAQMVLSQIEARFRDELGCAEKIVATTAYGKPAVLYRPAGDVVIWDMLVQSDGVLYRYHDTGETGTLRIGYGSPLISNGGRMEDLKMSFDFTDAAVSGGVMWIKNVEVTRDGHALAGPEDIAVRCLNIG